MKKPTYLTSCVLAASVAVACLSLGQTAMAGNKLNKETSANKSSSASKPPKLVVVLVVDGLPQEQISRYSQQFQGGFKRLLNQGAWYSDAHQAHGITVTAIGHSAILSGAYPYQHGIIGNSWTDPSTLQKVYCTEDSSSKYLDGSTKPRNGTSPKNLRVSTLGDELRYATGKQAKVVAVSGKDRGAILLAGKTGTAYMYLSETGSFSSATYYMAQHPQWVKSFQAGKRQDQFYGKPWCLAQDAALYAQDEGKDIVANKACPKGHAFGDIQYVSKSGKPDAEYYEELKSGPYVDQMSLEFARAAVEGENLGNNPAGVPDLLAVSLSSHDYVNHGYGPESKKSHDHLQHLDKQLGDFFHYLDKKIGIDNTLVVLTADHGFPNVPEFASARHFDANRIDDGAMAKALKKMLQDSYGDEKIIAAYHAPQLLLNYPLIAKKGLQRDEVENNIARFLLKYDGIAQVYTRSQLENGNIPQTHMGKLMQRAWNRQLSGDILLVTKPYWYFGEGEGGTSHGSPYSYDTNVPLILMGKPWIKPGYYSTYAEVVDIAPSLSHLLRLRPPSASEGRVLGEALR